MASVRQPDLSEIKGVSLHKRSGWATPFQTMVYNYKDGKRYRGGYHKYVFCAMWAYDAKAGELGLEPVHFPAGVSQSEALAIYTARYPQCEVPPTVAPKLQNRSWSTDTRFCHLDKQDVNQATHTVQGQGQGQGQGQ
eukprot:CAMPEP_0182564992 /NCGR_PEP_ID=MMETSP1324-20130603/6814_1 /TAXON_ID=236786 /ORGANISM="Florenciella sp., Strain RCC1587" /LENGTH=136 /DNA_ID=CAMNT_0024778565 /DNA_START=71 /DNA_END=478 /DNA_ORIENTATION=+